MKPSGVKTSFISRSLDLLSKRIETPAKTEQFRPMTLQESSLQEFTWQEQWLKELRRQQTLKKAVAVIRSKSKTRQLMELWEGAVLRVRNSDTWFAKCEKFFQSPVWNLVSDEAIRKAHCKCEYWGCTRRAVQVHLLEFPEEHLEPDFDWMNRDNILMALCGHHHEMMREFVAKRAAPLKWQFDSTGDNRVPYLCAGSASWSPCRQNPPR